MPYCSSLVSRMLWETVLKDFCSSTKTDLVIKLRLTLSSEVVTMSNGQLLLKIVMGFLSGVVFFRNSKNVLTSRF